MDITGEMEDGERRHLLAQFLRTRRERLAPGDVGLPVGARRRTPGLRREEVALLAGMGASWYTSLEQGRDVHPSEQVLESLARTLRLTADERRYLLTLALRHEPAETAPDAEELSPALRRLVESLDPHPAYIMGRRWDALAWNRAAALVFSMDALTPPHSRNMLWRIFTNPRLREHNPNWERVARFTVAQFRSDYARYPGDPRFATLIADLRRACPEFAVWWSQHDVSGRPDCHKHIRHATLGTLDFEQVTMQPDTHPDLKIVILSAEPTTAALLQRHLRHETSVSAAMPVNSA